MQIDTSTAQYPNPYQSPSDPPVTGHQNPLSDVLRSIGRLDFETTIGWADVNDALAGVPFDAFNQVNLARMIADQLARTRPVVKAQPIDRRRAELPTNAPFFQPSPQAIHYSGPVSVSALNSTELSRHWQQSINRAAMKVGACSVILVITIFVTLGTSTAALIGCCAALAIFIPAWIRIIQNRP